MWDGFRNIVLPRLLFAVTVASAVALVAAVVVGPWLTGWIAHPLLEVFAQDITVRRTAVGSAIGLVVTAFVFFRPVARPKKTPPTQPKPGSMAGA